MRLYILGLVAALVCTRGVFAAEGDAGRWIESTPGNAAWHVSADGASAVLVEAKNGACVLEVTKSKLKGVSVKLSIETDAKTCSLVSGTADLPVELQADTVAELELVADPINPVLKIGGKESARTRGKWIEISARQAADPALRVKLSGATYATITFAGPKPAAAAASGPPAPSASQLFDEIPGPGDAPATPAAPAPGVREETPGKPASEAGPSAPSEPAPEAAPAPRRAPRPTPRAATPEPAGGRVLDRAKHCVFQIRIKDPGGEVVSGGSGFLFAAGGFGITNYHVVEGASSATAIFAGEKAELPVELWAVRKDLDLALVRIKTHSKDIDWRGTLQAVPSPAEGQEVWALGFPLDLGYSVTRGVVNGIRQSSQLPAEVTKTFPAVRSWIQTDCTINPGNSGGPLIDEEGALLGINTWVFLKGQNVYFAISAAEARALLPSTSQQPLGFSAVASGAAKKGQGTYQMFTGRLPRIKIKKEGTAEQLTSAVTGINTLLVRKCNSCGGDGGMSVRVTTGRTRTGRPIYDQQMRKCGVCEGKGSIEANDAAAVKIAGRFCQALAFAKPDTDARMQDALDRAYVAVTENLWGSPVASGALNEQAMRLLAPGTLKTEEPLLVTADYMFGNVPTDENERVHYLRMRGSDQMLVLVAPRLADEVHEGSVFVGGLIAGGMKAPDGSRVVVLQGGFIVKANRAPGKAKE